MIRILAPYILGAGIFASVIGGAVYFGIKWERDRQALDDAQDHIETRDRIDEAITANPDCPWLERLRGACE